ncbi:hypothetical protein FRACYDRAFT_236504 [Fragilariopsis cylindrus CCMP1102]|uniref:Uncharacterized protein n=1 Tax=Fragilariopsis cylindrus CCMP1102 TaxID=635003 RepID=A0A1E7FKB5_9STRA|nr:hypothetical protein FRACYDRAFT_236504 [Fragilariopsis cylindrus CCMP1102]|eukprot:OEU18233.1 hypothetical protein FRACYDRAFT_236504 [Fragilariopsis cylindrus CCMP1102]
MTIASSSSDITKVTIASPPSDHHHTTKGCTSKDPCLIIGCTNHVVKFNDVVSTQIHDTVLEEHPDTQDGPSIGLGWKYSVQEETLCDIRHDITYLTSEARRDKLKEYGFDSDEMNDAVKEIHKIHSDRLQSSNAYRLERKQQALEHQKQFRRNSAKFTYTAATVIKKTDDGSSNNDQRKNNSKRRTNSYYAVTTIKSKLKSESKSELKSKKPSSNATDVNDSIDADEKKKKKKFNMKRLFSWKA